MFATAFSSIVTFPPSGFPVWAYINKTPLKKRTFLIRLYTWLYQDVSVDCFTQMQEIFQIFYFPKPKFRSVKKGGEWGRSKSSHSGIPGNIFVQGVGGTMIPFVDYVNYTWCLPSRRPCSWTKVICGFSFSNLPSLQSLNSRCENDMYIAMSSLEKGKDINEREVLFT